MQVQQRAMQLQRPARFMAPARQAHRARGQLVTAAALASSKPRAKSGPGMQIGAQVSADSAVAAHAGAHLGQYIAESPRFFGAIAELPQGGKLTPLDIDNGLFELVVPRIQLFDLWIQPRATAVVRVEEVPGGATRLAIHTRDCKLQGSHHVDMFQLNDRFELDVRIHFTGVQPQGPGTQGTIQSRGHITVQVDMPPPFSFMPQSVLQSTGNAALSTTLRLLTGTFLTSMARDYNRWATTPRPAKQVTQPSTPPPPAPPAAGGTGTAGACEC